MRYAYCPCIIKIGRNDNDIFNVSVYSVIRIYTVIYCLIMSGNSVIMLLYNNVILIDISVVVFNQMVIRLNSLVIQCRITVIAPNGYGVNNIFIVRSDCIVIIYNTVVHRGQRTRIGIISRIR